MMHGNVRCLVPLVTAWVLACSGMLAQSNGPGVSSKSTAARVRAPGWWPTKGDRSRNEYAGAAECAECHSTESEDFAGTAMAHAATPASDSTMLRQHDHLGFQIGAYSYQIDTSGGKSILTVRQGEASHSDSLLWAFGAGRIAQTYVYEENGNFYEAHLSFYTAPQALDVTPGHPRTPPPNVVEGAGRLIPADEARRCFGCHTTASTTKNQFDPGKLVPGVTCEQCHGPGAAHVAAARAGNYKLALQSILNPAHLSPVESVDFCGACHRTHQDVLLDSPTSIGRLNVRFAPYRLENSRCWKAGRGDARITCLTCHDPHQPLAEDPAAYDSKCLQCHVAAGMKQSSDDHRTACPTGVQLCVTCHMPKFTNPGFHFTFTDHWIRIAPPGATLPD